ncbi:hypothetical protein HJG60_008284 [Phyllostomus discolor]|uniref:Uncharacterized protein n=1 Tax=Phyllostomus discolor TaxID=89673 RepID=A0A834DQI8_9CHIR|nr:hypothetical protein HJG60_008284 [Phyllostomus discolor]
MASSVLEENSSIILKVVCDVFFQWLLLRFTPFLWFKQFNYKMPQCVIIVLFVYICCSIYAAWISLGFFDSWVEILQYWKICTYDLFKYFFYPFLSIIVPIIHVRQLITVLQSQIFCSFFFTFFLLSFNLDALIDLF